MTPIRKSHFKYIVSAVMKKNTRKTETIETIETEQKSKMSDKTKCEIKRYVFLISVAIILIMIGKIVSMAISEAICDALYKNL